MRASIYVITVIVAVQTISACSNRQTYNSLQGARENECQTVVDAAQRNQCFDNAHRSYDRFEQQRNESRNQ